jgi:endonuclease/exonuclease/phosphatase family metal-dependent hydrolase
MSRWGNERLVGLHDAQVNEHHLTSTGLPADSRLRLLSFNIQVGISTERYRHYLTRGWQHLLPHTGRADNLQKIGNLLGDFDLVALQEADGGSLRSGYVNQVEHLAQLGAFPYWYQQLNRNLGRLGQHSNGVLSRLKPWAIEDHPLPGPKGRGAILVRFGEGPEALVVVMMHLALGSNPHPAACVYPRADRRLPASGIDG